MRVLGIDPSLTSTGIATLTMAGAVDTTAVVTKGRRDATLTDIDTRLRLIADHVLDHAHDVTLAVIEGPSIGSRGGSPWDRAGLWWRIVHRLLAADIPVASCAPTLRAKWATGKGNASKAQVSVAVSRLWPDVEAGCDDEWDALALATIGAQQLGWNVPTRAHHPACRLRVTWPTELLELEAAS